MSDYDVRYRLGGASTWTTHAFTGTGTSTTLTGLTPSYMYEVQVRATNDEGDERLVRSPARRPPMDNDASRDVDEHSPATTTVGSAVTLPGNGYTLTHSLSGAERERVQHQQRDGPDHGGVGHDAGLHDSRRRTA